MKVTKTPPPPEKLLRSGISLQKEFGRVHGVLFLGGNEVKQCYLLDLESNSWSKAGKLPCFHAVTEHISVVWSETQTITVYANVNFKDNKFEIQCAANKGLSSSDPEWQFVFKENVDIENFHIKNATIVDDRLVIFSRGKPRGVLEQCCSFLLSFKLQVGADWLVSGLDPNYNYIKLNEIMYAEFLSKPEISKMGDDVVLRMLQENNYSDSFPR